MKNKYLLIILIVIFLFTITDCDKKLNNTANHDVQIYCY